jgi:dsRNA-specific ribonuclease
VLDSIVVEALFKSPKQFPHDEMHLMRTALVNADFLAFLVMTVSTEVVRGDVSLVGTDNQSVETTTFTTRQTGLWKFMRHSGSWDMVNIQQKTTERLESCREEIFTALETSRRYPWTLLCHVGAGKFFSDLIESVLGAIFIDSCGSMEACHGFLERIGLMKYLRRVLTEDIDIMHPKERLGVLAAKQQLKVDYCTEQILPESEEGEAVMSEFVPWKCLLRVGEEEMAVVDNGVSKIDAETKAAEAAVAMMRMKGVNLADEIMTEVEAE